jgi:hypothetical protein
VRRILRRRHVGRCPFGPPIAVLNGVIGPARDFGKRLVALALAITAVSPSAAAAAPAPTSDAIAPVPARLLPVIMASMARLRFRWHAFHHWFVSGAKLRGIVGRLVRRVGLMK